jgi:hypothetical protein
MERSLTEKYLTAQLTAGTGNIPINQGYCCMDRSITTYACRLKWKLYVPSKLGYGEQGYGGKIEPNTTLLFDVELLAIKGK